jgi:hypothetical protein
MTPTGETCSVVFGASIEGSSRFESHNDFQFHKLVTSAIKSNFCLPQNPKVLSGGKIKFTPT